MTIIKKKKEDDEDDEEDDNDGNNNYDDDKCLENEKTVMIMKAIKTGIFRVVFFCYITFQHHRIRKLKMF